MGNKNKNKKNVPGKPTLSSERKAQMESPKVICQGVTALKQVVNDVLVGKQQLPLGRDGSSGFAKPSGK